jgi:hypothetical protein
MLPLGEERDVLLRLAMQSENSSKIERWFSLRPEKDSVH